MSGVAPWPPRSPCWTACIAAWPWWRVVCCAFIARAQPGMDDEPASLSAPAPAVLLVSALNAACRPDSAASPSPRAAVIRDRAALPAALATPPRPAPTLDEPAPSCPSVYAVDAAEPIEVPGSEEHTSELQSLMRIS